MSASDTNSDRETKRKRSVSIEPEQDDYINEHIDNFSAWVRAQIVREMVEDDAVDARSVSEDLRDVIEELEEIEARAA